MMHSVSDDVIIPPKCCNPIKTIGVVKKMNERLLNILIQSFPKILLPGLMYTIPLTVLAFAIGLVIAILTALVQFATIRVLKQIARIYIWIIRGTPLLVPLFVVFYGQSATSSCPHSIRLPSAPQERPQERHAWFPPHRPPH